jgi:hypothetical protein
MGQRARILTEILGFDGWKVPEAFFESAGGERVRPVRGFAVIRETKVVLVVERRWLARCGKCAGSCREVHERLPPRRWADLPWAGHSVELRYAPVRVECPRCSATPVEMVAWAEPYQRQTLRLQQHLALEAASTQPVQRGECITGIRTTWFKVRRLAASSAITSGAQGWSWTRAAIRAWNACERPWMSESAVSSR